MNVFVTGGSGFLGQHVVRRLVASGHFVSVLTRSESSSTFVQSLGAESIRGDVTQVTDFSEQLKRFDVVVHCAAPVEFWGEWQKFQSGIVDATLGLANACAKNGVKRFIHISSESVLQNRGSLIDIDESYPYPTHPNSNYGSAKKITEEQLLNLQSDMEIIILRPTFIWGQNCPSIVNIVNKVKSGQFVWIDNGTSSFEAVHVENVAEAVHQALTEGVNRCVYFITDDESSTIKEFFKNVFEELQLPVPTTSVPSWLASPIAYCIEWCWNFFRIETAPPISRFELSFVSMPRRYNINRAKNELKYKPVVSRTQGFKQLNTFLNYAQLIDGNC